MTAYLDQLFSLDGRTAVITGGSSGIGWGMARAIARAGAAVVLVARDAAALAARAAELTAAGGRAAWVSADLGDRAQAGRAAAAAAAAFGSPDILVNCAGLNLRPPLGELTVADWDVTMAVNLTAPFLLGQHFGPVMAGRGWGRIIHFSSTAGKTNSTLGGAHYTASKHGVLGIVRSMAVEFAPRGVTVNAVCPGLIDTEMVRSSIPPDRAAQIAASFPAGRLGEPGEVAELVAFLASERSGYITGAAFDINGGDLVV